MIHTAYPAGWYVDAWPNGGPRAVLIPSTRVVWTSWAGVLIPIAGSLPLYLCVSPIGPQLAGEASDAVGTLHFSPSGWTLDARIATGTFGCIFDRDGNLLIIEPAPGQTTQGFRQLDPVDGHPIFGDDAILAHGVSSYVDLGNDILVGQGHDGGGVVVWIDGALRRLAAGACYAIRAHRDGDAVAIAFYEVAPDGLTAYIYDGTIADLRRLPLANAPTPLPAPPPAPGLKTPAVTVDRFTLTPAAHLPDGDLLVCHDSVNAQLGTRVRVWVEQGSAYISIAYPGADPMLVGHTGARRPVR